MPMYQLRSGEGALETDFQGEAMLLIKEFQGYQMLDLEFPLFKTIGIAWSKQSWKEQTCHFTLTVQIYRKKKEKKKTHVKYLIPRRQLSNTCKQWNNTTQIHRRDSDLLSLPLESVITEWFLVCSCKLSQTLSTRSNCSSSSLHHSNPGHWQQST